MRRRLIILALCLTACGPPLGNSIPSPEPTAPVSLATKIVTPTNVSTPTTKIVTPMSVSTPTQAASASRVISFTTADGVILNGTIYGSGATAVILSTMGAQKQDTWAPFASEIAGHGYLALTYNFRYWVNETEIQDNLRDRAADDLRAAVDFVRKQGAKQVVLVGASLGGLASIKVAGAARPAAVVIMAAPFGPFPALPSLQVDVADLQAITAPKLFINTEHDGGGFITSTKRMFEVAPDPKNLQIYPGSAHGTDLFNTEHASDLTRRLIDFIEQNAPPDRVNAPPR